MRGQKATTVVLMSALGLGIGFLAAATAAHANPPGCTKKSLYITDSGGGHLKGEGTGECNDFGDRTLRVEVKQDLSFQPDPVAVSGSDRNPNFFYDAIASGCDNLNSGNYYTRTYFNGYSDYADTSRVHIDAC